MPSFSAHKGLTVNADFLDLLVRNRLDEPGLLAGFAGGTAVKKGRHRSVFRIEAGEGPERRTLYLKRHYWPLREKIRYLLPWLKREDAGNEWRNMVLLKELGFRTLTPVAFGTAAKFGVPVFSLTLTEEISGGERLDHYFGSNFAPPLSGERVKEKRALIRRLASLAAEFHGKGLNHQDFYLCHFLFRERDGEIFIVDIQRLHRSGRISTHDRVKDLAQLYYSAERTGIFSRTDYVRFVKWYSGKTRLAESDRELCARVAAKTERIARHDAKLRQRKKSGP